MMKLVFVLLPIISSGLRLKSEPEIQMDNENLNAIDNPSTFSLQSSEKTWLGSFLSTVEGWWFFWWSYVQYWCNFWTFGRCGGGDVQRIVRGPELTSCTTACAASGGRCDLGLLKRASAYYKKHVVAGALNFEPPKGTVAAPVQAACGAVGALSAAAYAPYNNPAGSGTCYFRTDAAPTTCDAEPTGALRRICACYMKPGVYWKVSATNKNCDADTCAGVATLNYDDKCSLKEQNKVSAAGLAKFMLKQATPVTLTSNTAAALITAPSYLSAAGKTSGATSNLQISDCLTAPSDGSFRICACRHR
jgi:hypothetical protein